MSAPRSSLALHRHPLSMPRRLKFSEEEKFLILEEVSLRKDILIPRSGRYKNTPARQRAWEEIAAAVSSLSPLVHRTPDEIRRKWDNMVIDARRELAMQKHPVLRQRPQKQLSHNILALFDKPGPGLPEPPLSASTFGVRAASDPSSPPTMLEVTPDLLLHGQSSTAAPGRGLLCPMEPSPASGPMLESCLSAASKAPNSKERLLPTGPQDITEKSLPPPSTAPSAPCPPAAVVLPAAAPPLSSSQDRGAAGMVPVLPASSPEPPRVKCPPSPVLAWPLLGATASPALQSGGTGSSPAPEINGSTSVPEGSQPYPRGCVCVAGERLEKQSRLQTEVLELQKEILQLQKEKIMMEKEKLLLEIVKLRRELGT
ncbi:vegetative cell wall protein gp1-like [Calypte anna]|uniref:vegetative cell wall protein gp1-like n=1 Tax=Calypte anna TaxID=9244 RepID=UPI0011C4795E|nr:vegetative cell wall protein gp1-like [Calypte anna]